MFKIFHQFSKLINEYLNSIVIQNKLLGKDLNAKRQWDLETGKKFNDLVSKYPISEDELLFISKDVCEYVSRTRITNLKLFLFEDNDYDIPRHPNDLKELDKKKK